MADTVTKSSVEKANASPSEPTLTEAISNEKGGKKKPGETWKKDDIHEIPHK
jgi:hypothetical protein